MNKGGTALLKTQALVAGYGKKQVLNGVDLEVNSGSIVALIGHNGAGKSTLLKAVFGMLPVWTGAVIYDGRKLNSAKPRDLLRGGMAYIVQGNRVFTDLSVHENLDVGSMILPNRASRREGIERALIAFPVLRERLKQQAGTLSGGEKQMLALANAMVLSPRLLLLDEPSLGLSPNMITEALGRIKQLNRDEGISILIVEQKVREVLNICHWVYCLKLGEVTYGGPPTALKNDPDKLRRVFL
ncbi:MAG: ABC transporter ATP-binding protein [Candidatus Eisenbacteria bacterium]|uniref:ABC transporter ATP-binding protein n=1 Tax=Eiseniibacteriota bacterium TaxID=2212470 RepID=A0A948RZ43_UNCEI|nr:ABC transporter ATP-binding protein [Candidatus Eisenbacteria bacterium]MBU2690889.1 ABC transporter ATP-binding protein [Candidatus Eisenbacteria bacterium]